MARPEKRFYRKLQRPKGFRAFEVVVGESDLWIAVPEGEYSPALERDIEETVISLRSQIELYAKKRKEFFTSLTPLSVEPLAPKVVKKMALECDRCGVGPMAGVAGAVNLFVGERLEELGVSQFLIENGGDIYLKRERETVALLLTGSPKLDGRLGVVVPPGRWGLSSSSSRIGHSLSLGSSQVATVLAEDPVYSDCCATFLGNSVSPEDALDRINRVKGALGALIFIDGRFVMKGELRPVLIDCA